MTILYNPVRLRVEIDERDQLHGTIISNTEKVGTANSINQAMHEFRVVLNNELIAQMRMQETGVIVTLEIINGQGERFGVLRVASSNQELIKIYGENEQTEYFCRNDERLSSFRIVRDSAGHQTSAIIKELAVNGRTAIASINVPGDNHEMMLAISIFILWLRLRGLRVDT